MTVKRYLYRKWLMLYSKIVREKASPEYIARGWAIGMFFGCFIPFGLQLVCSIPTAFLLKGSKIGATLGTLITNHFTIFIIYPVQCWVGNRILCGNLSLDRIQCMMRDVLRLQDYETLFSMGLEVAASFFVGGLLFAAVSTPVCYYAVRRVVINYRHLREKARAKKAGINRE